MKIWRRKSKRGRKRINYQSNSRVWLRRTLKTRMKLIYLETTHQSTKKAEGGGAEAHPLILGEVTEGVKLIEQGTRQVDKGRRIDKADLLTQGMTHQKEGDQDPESIAHADLDGGPDLEGTEDIEEILDLEKGMIITDDLILMIETITGEDDLGLPSTVERGRGLELSLK